MVELLRSLVTKKAHKRMLNFESLVSSRNLPLIDINRQTEEGKFGLPQR